MKFILLKLFGWKECDIIDYKLLFYKFGASVNCDPRLIDFHIYLNNEKYVFFKKNESAIFINVRNSIFFYLNNDILCSSNEIIFPSSKTSCFFIPCRLKTISILHYFEIKNKLPPIFNRRSVCTVKHLFSEKTNKNKRNQINRFLKHGGVIKPITDFTPDEITCFYKDIIKIRWGLEPTVEYLSKLLAFIKINKEMVFGSILFIENKIVAFDLILKSESRDFVYFDVVNGGYDTNHKKFSLGSILLWINLHNALSAYKSKKVRFSLGNPTYKYKLDWCVTDRLIRTF